MISSTKPLIKLSPISKNAGVAVISPASFANQKKAERGVDRLRSLGFEPRLGVCTQTRGPLYFAGTPEQRLDDLHAAFADGESDIIASVRGGYGSNYLLDGLNKELIRNHPKPFFGYSDLTGVQLHLLDQLGLPAFHGPMVAADFADENGVHVPSLRAALGGEPYSVGNAEGLRALKPGTARGTLYGGCLSILVALLGTPWEPATEGKLLFIEDLAVKPYQVDRMLWQLRAAGKLNGVRGIIFGEMLDCVSPGAPADLLEQVILHIFRDVDFPVAIGLRSGHVSRENVTLTLGVEAELIVDANAQLHILEAAVNS
jgi:muramoyltetrapeptide carboxypeptidase